ncbi:MAG: dienelactone hydrolase family protein [Caulobacterales bacterium]|jgi:dienelactone hydrolase
MVAVKPPPIAAAETVAARIERLQPHWDVYLPAGDGPFPVVVQMHGCGGKKPFQKTYAEVAQVAGAAVIVVDSHGPRGIGVRAAYAFVCTGLQLWGRERAGDLYAAFAWARTQSWADPNALIAAGWSHGGWTVLDALALQPGKQAAAATGLSDLADDPLAGLAGGFVVYPYCGFACLAAQRPIREVAALYAVLAGEDRVVGVRAPRAALLAQINRGRAVKLLELPGATHAFDEPEAKDVRQRFDPAATAQTQHFYTALIQQVAAR